MQTFVSLPHEMSDIFPALAKPRERERERGGKWGKKHGSPDIFLYIDYEGANVLFSQFKIKTPCCYTLTTAPPPPPPLSVLHTLSTSCNTHLCCLTIDWMSFAGDFCVRKYAQCLEQDQHSHVCILPCLDLISLLFSLCLAFLHFDDARRLDSSVSLGKISSAC